MSPPLVHPQLLLEKTVYFMASIFEKVVIRLVTYEIIAEQGKAWSSPNFADWLVKSLDLLRFRRHSA